MSYNQTRDQRIKELKARFDKVRIKEYYDLTKPKDTVDGIIDDLNYRAKIDKFYEENYDTLRKDFEDYLVEEADYPRLVAEESNDWFAEWLEKEYNIRK